MEKRLRWYWRNPTDLHSWRMDETYIKVKGAMDLPAMVQLIDGVIRLTFTFPLDGTVNQPIVFLGRSSIR